MEQIPEFTPLADAIEGESVRYSAMESREIHYRIVQVGPTTVKTQVIVYDHGKPLGEPATRVDSREGDPLAKQALAVNADRRVMPAKIKAAGRAWQALLYEDRWIDEEIQYLRRTWVSPQVPVFGTIRMELYGDDTLEAQLELVEFQPNAKNQKT